MHRPRHGRNRAAAGGGGLHRVHGPAARVRLDDDERLTENGDHAVARREAPAVGAGAQRSLRQQHALLPHRLPELRVTRRIDDVEARGHDSDRCAAGGRAAAVGGPAARRAGAVVGRAVDAVGQTGDDRDPRLGQVMSQLGRHLPAVVGAAPGPDDRHPRRVENPDPAQAEQHGRRLGVAQQSGRVAGFSLEVHADPQRGMG